MKLKTTLLGKTYTFRDIKQVLAKANEEKTGDQLAGLAAESAQERVAAKVVLSALTLADLREHPAVPYESDEVTRIIQDDVNETVYERIRGWTVSDLREWILDETTTGSDIRKLSRGLTAEMIAAVCKLMGNLDLIYAASKITVTAPADTVHVNDSLHITGAAITLSAGDDAIHSDTSVAILGGSITVNTCCEGIEAPEILVEDGAITVTSTDDGINACGTETSDGSLPGVTISGGTVTLLNPSGRDADGIDSNGNIDINGGLVYISLVGDGGNCALDYGSENGGACRINGGTVVACGGSTMLEAMSENSAQPSILCAGTTQAAGTEITLQDSSGKILLTYAAPNSFSAVLVSCPEMATGSTYTLTLGDTAQEIPLTQVATTYGISGGMGGGMPGGGR